MPGRYGLDYQSFRVMKRKTYVCVVGEVSLKGGVWPQTTSASYSMILLTCAVSQFRDLLFYLHQEKFPKSEEKDNTV